MCRLSKPVFADDVFAFTLPATVAIRDWRLGVIHKLFLILVFAYVVVYELLINEGFRKPVDITGAVRVVLRNPEPAARLQPCPAYCLDTFQQCGGPSQPQYNISADRANYTYVGGGGVMAPRRPCPYADSAWVQTDSLQPEGVFVPTTITVRTQQVQPAGYPCSDFQLGLPACSYNTTNTSTIVIPDAEEFVLRIDHSFATTSGLTRTSRQVRSILLGPDGQPMDECAAYRNDPSGCPTALRLDKGRLDSLSLRTLLYAAGIRSLGESCFPQRTAVTTHALRLSRSCSPARPPAHLQTRRPVTSSGRARTCVLQVSCSSLALRTATTPGRVGICLWARAH